MRYRILALVILLTAAGAYFATSHDEVRAGVRIVQAPPTAAASAPTESVRGNGPYAVGFTLFEGRLYLVSTSDRDAAAKPDQLTAPTFVCDEKNGTVHTYEAWPLRNNGGSGTVPQFDHDGRLLTAVHTGTPLQCALQEGPK